MGGLGRALARSSAVPEALSYQYVAELKKPRVMFGSTLRVLAMAGTGFLIGIAVR